MKKKEFSVVPVLAEIYKDLTTLFGLMQAPFEINEYELDSSYANAALLILKKLGTALCQDDMVFNIKYPTVFKIVNIIHSKQFLLTTKLRLVFPFLVEVLYQETSHLISKEQRDLSISLSLARQCEQSITYATTILKNDTQNTEMFTAIAEMELQHLYRHLQHFPIEIQVLDGDKEDFTAALSCLTTIGHGKGSEPAAVNLFLFRYAQAVSSTIDYNTQLWYQQLSK